MESATRCGMKLNRKINTRWRVIPYRRKATDFMHCTSCDDSMPILRIGKQRDFFEFQNRQFRTENWRFWQQLIIMIRFHRVSKGFT